MINKDINERYSKIVNSLLFLFPIGILNQKHSGDLVLFLLMLTGVYIVFTTKINPFKQVELKLFSVLTVGYFGVIILSIVMSDNPAELLHFASRDLHFLFAPLVVLAIYKADINFDKLVLAIKLSLILIGGYISYQYLINGTVTDWRLSHGTSPILTVIMLVFSWINIDYENKRNFILTVISSILAIFLVIISAERGAFLGLLALSSLFIVLKSKNRVNKKRIKIFATILILLITSITLSNTNLLNRLSSAVKDVKAWIANDGEFANSSASVVIRLEMYKGGLLAAKEKPLFGYGYRNTTGSTAKFTNDKNLPYSISRYNHLHNTFVNTLVFGGIVALITLFALVFLPLNKFWKAFKLEYNIQYAILGILLISSYIVLSSTHVMFGGVAENAFYIFFMGVLLPRVINAKV